MMIERGARPDAPPKLKRGGAVLAGVLGVGAWPSLGPWALALALGLACWAGLGCGINRYLSTLNPPLKHCASACATINVGLALNVGLRSVWV